MTAIQYISQLGGASAWGATDLLPVTQGSTGPLTGTTRKLTVAQLFASPQFSGTTRLGSGAFNYATVTGGATGNPVTFTTIGGDADVDASWVLPGRGLVSVPRMLVGTHSAGSGIASPRLYTLTADQTISGSGGQAYRVGGILRGTLSASLTGYYFTGLDEDRIAFSNTSHAMTLNFISSTLRAGWSGGRTLQQTQLYVGNPALPGSSAEGSAGSSAYHVSGSAFAYSYTSAGGVTGDPRGNLFGRNDATRVRSGSGYHWNSTFGNETDVGVAADCEVQWKGGIKVVQWADDANRGVIQDYAYGMNLQVGGTAPGWRIGFALGGFEGWWPFTSSSTIMRSIDANVGGGPAKNIAAGINFSDLTIGESAFKAPGFIVDGSGNLGALTASGVALQTRSAVVAKTAVVNAVTVLEGGLYAGTITLTGTAPAGSGTTATFSVGTVSIPYINNINAAGSGYAEGDTITLVGGTSTVTAVGVVTKVFNGGVQGIKMTTPGNYSVVPSSPIATTTSGSGTGLTVTPQLSLLTVTVAGAGTNYSEFLPPTISSAGSLATYRQATLKVTMTATEAPLVLNTTQPTKVVSLTVGANQVVGARQTGWTAPTGTVSRATFDQSTVTLPQLAQRVAALVNDLTTHGLIGA